LFLYQIILNHTHEGGGVGNLKQLLIIPVFAVIILVVASFSNIDLGVLSLPFYNAYGIAVQNIPTTVSTMPFAVQQVQLWTNATNSSGYAWGAAGILNNGTSDIWVTGIVVGNKWVPLQNWYVDINQTDVTQVNFQSTYIVTSMNATGFLKESAALSPNACLASPTTLRIDFDGVGPNPALCLQSRTNAVLLHPSYKMIVYFMVPNGTLLPSKIGTSVNVKISSSVSGLKYTISSGTVVNDLNRFNLIFWLETGQAYYPTTLQILASNLKSGDLVLIGGKNSNASTALIETQKDKQIFKPGVKVKSFRVYYNIGNLTKYTPGLPAGYDYILYNYEKGTPYSPEFTTNETLSIIYFDEANAAINQYNANTGSHAKLIVTPPYPQMRWAVPPWDWALAAQHMGQIDVMMSGYALNPYLPIGASSVISQIRLGSPQTENEIQLSLEPSRNQSPQQVANAIYILQGVGVNNTLVFYNTWQNPELVDLFASFDHR
jgi:hypothetical protein